MSYQIGTSTSVSGLIDKIRVFAVANGWTEDGWDGTTLNLHSGGVYAHFQNDTDVGNASNPGPFLRIKGSSGFSAAGFSGHPDLSNVVSCNKSNGPFSVYHLFVTTQYIHCVFQNDDGHWRHIAVGSYDKSGSFTGGTYIQALSWYYGSGVDSSTTTAHSVPFDSCIYYHTTASFCLSSAEVAGVYRWFNHQTHSGDIYPAKSSSRKVVSHHNLLNAVNINLTARSPNVFNQLTTLAPLHTFVHVGSNAFAPIGTVSDLRAIDMTNYRAGDIITIGADQWVVFPVTSQFYVDNLTPYSANDGFAYRKVP